MKEKKPKSFIVVFATMLFLLMFIVLPPLFRSMFPVDDVVQQPANKNYTLVCSKVSVSEKLRVVSKIGYDNHEPISNKITYMSYAADATEAKKEIVNNTILTVAQELALFRKIEGISIKDVKLTTVVTIDKAIVAANVDNLEFINFLLPSVESQMEYYEGQGYSCNIN